MIHHVWHFGCISKYFHNPFTSLDDPNSSECSRSESAKPWSLWSFRAVGLRASTAVRCGKKKRRNIATAEMQPSSAVSGRPMHPTIIPF